MHHYPQFFNISLHTFYHLQASPFSKAFAPEQHSIYDRLWHNFHMESVSLLPHLHHRQRHRAFVHLACVTWEMKYLTGRRSESLLFLFYDMLNCCLPHPPRINACMHVRRSHERLFLWLRAENACTIFNLNLFYLILCCQSHASCAAERWCVFAFLMNVSAVPCSLKICGVKVTQSSI